MNPFVFLRLNFPFLEKNSDDLEGINLNIGVNHNIELVSEDKYSVELELELADKDGKLSVRALERAVFSTNKCGVDLIEKIQLR